MPKISLQNQCVLIIGDKRCIISAQNHNKVIKCIKIEAVEPSKIPSGNISYYYI